MKSVIIIIIIIIKITIILIYRVAKPLAVARHVMENSPHSILVGQGAQEYAVKNGFPVEPNSALQTHESIEAFEVKKSDLRFASLAFILPTRVTCFFSWLHVRSVVLKQKIKQFRTQSDIK